MAQVRDALGRDLHRKSSTICAGLTTRRPAARMRLRTRPIFRLSGIRTVSTASDFRVTTDRARWSTRSGGVTETRSTGGYTQRHESRALRTRASHRGSVTSTRSGPWPRGRSQIFQTPRSFTERVESGRIGSFRRRVEIGKGRRWRRFASLVRRTHFFLIGHSPMNGGLASGRTADPIADQVSDFIAALPRNDPKPPLLCLQ